MKPIKIVQLISDVPKEGACCLMWNMDSVTKYWFLNRRFHREDGPAVEDSDGFNHYYLNGKRYDEQDYWRVLYRRGKITKEELFLKLL